MLEWLHISTWLRVDPLWSLINCYLCCFWVCKGMGCCLWCLMWYFCKALQLFKGNRTRMGLELRSQLRLGCRSVQNSACLRSSWSTKLVWHWASKWSVLACGSDNEQGLCSNLLKPVCVAACAGLSQKCYSYHWQLLKRFCLYLKQAVQMLSFCFPLPCYEADAFFVVSISSVSHWWNSIPLRQLWDSSDVVEELGSVMWLWDRWLPCHGLLHA